eukprot:gnl/MRDRNA2_/MRDRNA2_86824_c0_seq1.p1 gnl/MRDRNA2_/MRDRNA2_86824_c0~~gnl/MRDRNA2_/MRDRNA2_86824_c0_seq1.p1  ORF type:complete len:1493 (+),score=413.45 gnl/MRDRNA2_/MRDRNA2_86824_c0_seq1:82-4560(+)
MIRTIVIFLGLTIGAESLTLQAGGQDLRAGEGPVEKLQGLALSEPLETIGMTSLPAVILHLKFWHMAAGAILTVVALALLAFRRRRRLMQEEDANVKSGLALLWALSNKDITSRIAYFTKRRTKETVLNVDGVKVNTQEFEDKTLKIASALMRGLVAKGETVMICLPQGMDFYNIITACLRAGISFVPVAPQMMQETEQLEKLIKEIKPGVVITSDALNVQLRALQAAQSMRRITSTDLNKTLGETMRIRTPKGSDAAITIFNGASKSGPTTVSFSNQNVWAMVDAWLQAGMHSKAIASALADHTDITAISFFLGTVCSGAQYVVNDAAKPSLKTLADMGLSHGLLSDAALASFDFTAVPKPVERTLYVTTPTASFVDAAMAKNIKVRAVHNTPLQCGGISGVATKVQVLQEELKEGVIKYLSMTQRLKQGAKVGTQPDSVTFVSQGLLQDNVDLLIRRGEQCVEDDMIGEIHVRSNLQAPCATAKNVAGFVSTGEYGFISSKDLHLYITAGLGDSIILDNRQIVAAKLEQTIASKNQLSQAAVFTVNMKDGSTKVAIAGETKETTDAKATVAKLQRFAQQEKLPLAAISLLKPGDMPATRADTKILFIENKLATVAGGSWKIVERSAAASEAQGEEEEVNLDDVEQITFAAKGAEKRGARKDEILAGAIRELEKMGVPATKDTEEFQLTSQQMAQAAKRFERMLQTPAAEWTKMGVAGDAAPWGEGICIRQEIEVGAMLFLDTEGNVQKIMEQLERKKFPTTKEVGAIAKAVPKLADAKYEGTPMNITTYRALEVMGSLMVALVMGLALGVTLKMCDLLKNTFLANAGLGFPIFLISFSGLTLIFKWTIIGKYKPCALARYSPAFYKWWVMDRLVETWEGWAAVFMMETPMLVIFYRWAGADVDYSANVANTIREFDLVKIGVDGDIGGSIVTHLVTPQGVIMHNVHIGAACKIDSKAMLSPNCIMEDGSTLDKCEIAQPGTTIKAPAEPRQADRKAAIKLQVCQLFCNLFAGVVFMGNFIAPPATALATSVRMSSTWTFLGANASLEGPYFLDATRWVCYYMVFLWTMGVLLLAWSVVFKWVFIGRLKDGHVTSGMWWDLRVYMLNFWWTLCYMFFLQYWIDCTLLAITCYNLFGANVSYRTGLRFLQNMNPWHADFMTIKDGANMSNAKLHPSTPEKRNVLKNIVLEENTFVGLMSLVSGGVTLHKGSAVATTTRCTQDVHAGQTLIGQKLMGDAKKDQAKAEELDFSKITTGALALDLAIALGLRVVVNAGFIFFLACTVAACFVANDFLPVVLVVPAAFLLASFFLGVAYAKLMEMLLHPKIVADLTIGQDIKASTWLQYLQALYLSQAYTFSMVNGSALCAAMHKILGADCPLDAQWYSTAIRDQCLLKVGHNSVVDSTAYLVGHVGQPGGVLSFKKASLGDNCTLHPGSIILSGQHLKSGSTLDMYSHSHIEKIIPENKFYSGNPASAEVNSRVNKIAAGLPKDQ